MRNRSLTIFAKNEEQYLNEYNNLPKVGKKNISSQQLIYPNDSLSFKDSYELSELLPSLSELERSDENELLNSIKNMNSSLKNQLLSIYSTMNSIELNKLSPENSLINENFYAFDKIIKIMIMGSKGSGKTSFLSSILNKLNNCSYDNILHSKPTLSLEIRKKICKFNNSLINLELWDTNEQILLSPVIKTYLKICHNFIIICDNSSDYSIKFSINQIENIIKHSLNFNILIVTNNKSKPIINNKIIDFAQKFSFRVINFNDFDLCNMEEYLAVSY